MCSLNVRLSHCRSLRTSYILDSVDGGSGVLNLQVINIMQFQENARHIAKRGYSVGLCSTVESERNSRMVVAAHVVRKIKDIQCGPVYQISS